MGLSEDLSFEVISKRSISPSHDVMSSGACLFLYFAADIQRLPHGETVCRFCGVSYLVHHEIKRLEDAVESMKGQLKRCVCGYGCYSVCVMCS